MSIYKTIYMYYLNKLYNIVDKSYNSIKHRKIRQFRFEHINIPLKNTHNTTESNQNVKFRRSQTLKIYEKVLL